MDTITKVPEASHLNNTSTTPFTEGRNNLQPDIIINIIPPPFNISTGSREQQAKVAFDNRPHVTSESLATTVATKR